MNYLPINLLGLVGIDNQASDSCLNCEGGVARVLAIECEGVDLDASGFDTTSLELNAIASNGNGFAGEYIADDDDTGNFSLVYDEATETFTLAGFLKFDCLTREKIAEGNRLSKGCCFVFIVELNSCITLVFGIDVVTSCSVDGELRRSVKKVKVAPSFFTGTEAEKPRLELNISGSQRCALVLDTDVLSYDDVKATFGL